MTLTTTLAEIRSHGPCDGGFAKIRKHLGVSASDAKTHSEPFPVSLLLETNGLDDAIWVFGWVAPRPTVDAFLIRRLDTGDYSALKSMRLNPVAADWWRDCEAAILRVVDLLRRRMAGEDVSSDMEPAANAAYAAADAAAYAADAAAYAAYAAARAAAEAAAYAADAAAYAAYAAARAADAAAYAADAAAYAAAYAAANAASREDLLAVLSGDAT